MIWLKGKFKKTTTKIIQVAFLLVNSWAVVFGIRSQPATLSGLWNDMTFFLSVLSILFFFEKLKKKKRSDAAGNYPASVIIFPLNVLKENCIFSFFQSCASLNLTTSSVTLPLDHRTPNGKSGQTV